MSDLEKTLAQPTMSSIEMLEMVNNARMRHGEVKIENRHFLARIEDELDGELPPRKNFTHPSNGLAIGYYDLTLDQCRLVGMRESKGVRRWVLERLKELEAPQVPQTYSQALLEAGRLAQLAEEQAQQLALAAPKVNFFDKVVERTTLMTATQVAQKLGMSAIKLNKHLDELDVYSLNVKRARTFKQWVLDKGFGQLKQTELGYSQPLFTTAGEAWIVERLTSEGVAC